jgi:hypothetical protein
MYNFIVKKGLKYLKLKLLNNIIEIKFFFINKMNL